MTFTFAQVGKLDPYFVGFEQLWDKLASFEAAKSTPSPYPPYNIIKGDDDTWVIEIAVAGFSEKELSVEHDPQDSSLTVSGNQESKKNEYVHKGIANRTFTRTWTLQDYVEVESADLQDGLISITLKKVLPESKRPKKIDIGNGKKRLLKSDES